MPSYPALHHGVTLVVIAAKPVGVAQISRALEVQRALQAAGIKRVTIARRYAAPR